jgi:hypothetical protein
LGSFGLGVEPAAKMTDANSIALIKIVFIVFFSPLVKAGEIRWENLACHNWQLW